MYQGVIRTHVCIFCHFLPCCSSGDVSGESSEVEENRLLKDLPSQMCADRDQLLSRHAALTSRVGAHVQASHIYLGSMDFQFLWKYVEKAIYA